jgi:DNA polymerase elongation subunit (family B)
LSYVDAILDKDHDRIHVVERVNGNRLYNEFVPNYTFYYNDPRGKYRTLYGTPVSKFTTRSGKEFQKEIRMHSGKQLWESDLNPVFRCLEENYQDKPAPRLQTAFFDIEVGFDPLRGFSEVTDPFNPVTAISLYLDWVDKLITLAVPPKNLSKETAGELVSRFDNVLLFDDETAMMKAFLDIIDDADILSGWNSETYDIPYVINRITKILSKNDTRRLCLWNQYPKLRKFERFGKESITYDLVGRVHMDYMQLYRKYTYHEMHSYSLDAICEYELNERKTVYEGTLDQLYNRDFEKFIEYNRQDTHLLHKLNLKLKFLDLACELAHQNTVLLQTTMGAVAVTEQAIINEAHHQGIIVPNRKHKLDSEDSDPPAAGAYVATPKKGLHEDIAAIDIKSLYPSTIRALNMGNENIVGQLRPTMTEHYLKQKMEKEGCSYSAAWEGIFGSLEYTAVINQEAGTEITIDWEETKESTVHSAAEIWQMIFNSNQAWLLSANGTIFSYDKKGIIPGLLERWYSDRQVLQNTKKRWGELGAGLALPDRFSSLAK